MRLDKVRPDLERAGRGQDGPVPAFPIQIQTPQVEKEIRIPPQVVGRAEVVFLRRGKVPGLAKGDADAVVEVDKFRLEPWLSL